MFFLTPQALRCFLYIFMLPKDGSGGVQGTCDLRTKSETYLATKPWTSFIIFMTSGSSFS